MYEPFEKISATTADRIAFALCQIIDDDAPMRWTRYRFVAECIAKNPELMAELNHLAGYVRGPDAVTILSRIASQLEEAGRPQAAKGVRLAILEFEKTLTRQNSGG